MFYINFPEHGDGSSIVAHLYRARICKHLESPGIDAKESIRPADVASPARMSNMVVVPARQAGNRFLDATGTAVVVDTVRKFATGVNDAGVKIRTISDCLHLKGNLKVKVICVLTLLPKGVLTK
jgi:hypothetical protein